MFETASAIGKDVRSRKVAHSGIPTPRAGWNVGRRERRGTASTAMILAPTRPPTISTTTAWRSLGFCASNHDAGPASFAHAAGDKDTHEGFNGRAAEGHVAARGLRDHAAHDVLHERAEFTSTATSNTPCSRRSRRPARWTRTRNREKARTRAAWYPSERKHRGCRGQRRENAGFAVAAGQPYRERRHAASREDDRRRLAKLEYDRLRLVRQQRGVLRPRGPRNPGSRPTQTARARGRPRARRSRSNRGASRRRRTSPGCFCVVQPSRTKWGRKTATESSVDVRIAAA